LVKWVAVLVEIQAEAAADKAAEVTANGGFNKAMGVTAVVGNYVTVITLFTGITETITTIWFSLILASGVTAVAGNGVTVIALFTGIEISVSAEWVYVTGISIFIASLTRATGIRCS
jgi:hypothetical protein